VSVILKIYRNKSLQGLIKAAEIFSISSLCKNYPEHQHKEK